MELLQFRPATLPGQANQTDFRWPPLHCCRSKGDSTFHRQPASEIGLLPFPGLKQRFPIPEVQREANSIEDDSVANSQRKLAGVPMRQMVT